jgi:hypothetical protein
LRSSASGKTTRPKPAARSGLVLLLYGVELREQQRPQRIRQHHASILLPFAASHRDLTTLEIQVLHAQRETLL